MPSLKEVAQIIREDNDVIIDNQGKQTESLDGINKNFDRFFTLQERDKLDRFERRKEEDRKRPRGVGAPPGPVRRGAGPPREPGGPARGMTWSTVSWIWTPVN